MQENQLKKSLFLLGGIIASLLLLSFVHEFTIGDVKVKQVNILSDLKPDPPPPVVKKKDTVKKKPEKELVAVKKDCPPGITCLEDFSEKHNALAKFFKALGDANHRPVRVAFFGDSFIEGDILCASFRDTLQQLYGGHGVGFVPITSQVTQFRNTIKHTFGGYKTYWAVGDKNPYAPLGMSGYCFVPEQSNEVEYKPGARRYNQLQAMKLFYVSHLPSLLKYTVNDTLVSEELLAASDTLQRTILPTAGAGSIKLHFDTYDSLRLYGVSFEENTGVYVDNFAMRGNSGMGLLQIDPRELNEFNRFQNYKLILLQYGLNVVSESDSIGYEWYADKMVKLITRLKESFPETSIVLVSVSDRSYNKDGEFVTIPGIVDMRDAQRSIAKKSGVAFWDLFTAMGGKNSMVSFVTATPSMAGKDYTHVNAIGGRKLAKKLADAILHERVKYGLAKKK